MAPETVIAKRTEIVFLGGEEARELSEEDVREAWERVRGGQPASLRYERNELTGELRLKLYPFAKVSQQTTTIGGAKADSVKSWGLKLTMLGAPVASEEFGDKDEFSYFISEYWMPIKRSVSKQVTLCCLAKRDVQTGERTTDLDLLVDFRCEQTDKTLAEASEQLAEVLRELVAEAKAASSPAARLLDKLSTELLFALIHEE